MEKRKYQWEATNQRVAITCTCKNFRACFHADYIQRVAQSAPDEEVEELMQIKHLGRWLERMDLWRYNKRQRYLSKILMHVLKRKHECS